MRSLPDAPQKGPNGKQVERRAEQVCSAADPQDGTGVGWSQTEIQAAQKPTIRITREDFPGDEAN